MGDPTTRTSDGTWLGIGAASRLVGVDPATLRRWADDGLVEVNLTPGGHRRFQRRSLERVMAARAATAPTSPARIGGTPARLTAAYRRTYRGGGAGVRLAGAVPETDHPSYRETGRGLVDALVRTLDADDPAVRATALDDASALAHALGTRLSDAGISLTEAVSLFVAARRPFLTELGALARRRSLAPRQVVGLFDDASDALDRCLLRFIDGHRGIA
jgi:hypothetical protein